MTEAFPLYWPNGWPRHRGPLNIAYRDARAALAS